MTAATPRPAPPVCHRTDFRFSPTGRYAASIRIGEVDAVPEIWQCAASEITHRCVAGMALERDADLLPRDDGTVLVLTRPHPAADRHEVTLLNPLLPSDHPVALGTVPAVGGYLLPVPEHWTAHALMIALDDADGATIWRINPAPAQPERLLQLPGALSGGTWLDTEAGVLGLNHFHPGQPSNGIAVNLTTGSWQRIWSLSEKSTDRIVCYAPSTRRLVVSSNASGETRLGWGILGEGTVHFPDVLHRAGYPRSALGFDPHGHRLLVHEIEGTVSRLHLYTPGADELTPLPCPPGTVTSPIDWTDDVLRLPYSHPTHPPTIATVQLGAHELPTAPDWSLPSESTPHEPAQAANVDRVQVAGATGPMEAIAYGGPEWQHATHLVVALHGGPLAAWRYEFEPLFHHLAAAGIAVLAPNYRGSTGYGAAFSHAVLGDWGGPDLADVQVLAQRLATQRAERGLAAPVVWGASYGAFLALLAAGTEPQSWSGCVALAPFLSATALYAAAEEPVQRRIDHLGMAGADPSDSRDVLQACSTLSAPLLLVHGSRDERIPVQQSRMLRDRLLELGRRPGPDLDYREPDTDHAGVVAHHSVSLRRRITDFCRARAGCEPVGAGRGGHPAMTQERG